MALGAAQRPPKEATIQWQGLTLNPKTSTAEHSRTRRLHPHSVEAIAPSLARGATRMPIMNMSVCGSKRTTANGRGALRLTPHIGKAYLVPFSIVQSPCSFLLVAVAVEWLNSTSAHPLFSLPSILVTSVSITATSNPPTWSTLPHYLNFGLWSVHDPGVFIHLSMSMCREVPKTVIYCLAITFLHREAQEVAAPFSISKYAFMSLSGWVSYGYGVIQCSVFI
jgi:hypothetical protein